MRKVTTSWNYNWRNFPASKRAQANMVLNGYNCKAQPRHSDETYRMPCIRAEAADDMAVSASRKRIARFMLTMDLQSVSCRRARYVAAQRN